VWWLQIVMLGVCLGKGGAGGSSCDDLTLQPLPLYTVPSDNVIMTCIASTGEQQHGDPM
jgi:nuclear pore complex protein Nup155